MPKKEPDEKKSERGEHEKESKSKSAAEEDRESENGKDPEPPGNLRRRGDWFQKRH